MKVGEVVVVEEGDCGAYGRGVLELGLVFGVDVDIDVDIVALLVSGVEDRYEGFAAEEFRTGV